MKSEKYGENAKQKEYRIALAGNPNVGKSTIFNALTGMKQHTGNWTGKTVSNAEGKCTFGGDIFIFTDLPGTYSLFAHSAEEEIARDYICFQEPDAIIVVCDATCLERNINLVLQTTEISKKVIVCVNLLDEAQKKNISVNLKKLSQSLGVPVVGTVARNKKSVKLLLESIAVLVKNESESSTFCVHYGGSTEKAIKTVESALKSYPLKNINPRWLSLKLLSDEAVLINKINEGFGFKISEKTDITEAVREAHSFIESEHPSAESFNDEIVTAIVSAAEKIAASAVTRDSTSKKAQLDRKIDGIITSRIFGYPLMLVFLALIFWITVTGANVPSTLLSSFFSKCENYLNSFMSMIGIPELIRGLTVDGMFRVLGWVISVMLPPMAIFFPLFTLLEDVGYLPRIAYNLDKPFKKCNACGKQALTMCMGFGCNAVGVVGCRIIDSPRERLLAILTNSFVPCNGRFPAIISVITMFFVGTAGFKSITASLLLTVAVLIGVGATLLITKLLSKTILKGYPSSFTLEMPSYRMPQIGQVVIRSVFDRTLFVLGRAVAVAAPAGMLIWLMANISVGGTSILNNCATFFDPFGRIIGLDGIIITAFILGFPANEIVIPLSVMAYMSSGNLNDICELSALKSILADNGWTPITAVCFIMFSLMHWPCSTTLLTVKKETGSIKWTVLSALIPTVCGTAVCAFVNLIAKCFI